MEFFAQYAGFLLRTVTVVVAIVMVLLVIAALRSKGRGPRHGHLQVHKLNDVYQSLRERLEQAVLDKHSLKIQRKAEAKHAKQAKKDAAKKPRVFVLDFDGDIKASATDNLRHEITALLSMATANDEVVLRLESGGGMVHSYGLASSQLVRIRDAGIPLTVCVDKVAASGGYMMACIADRIVAAPFAVLGSIGVVAQIPNFHRLLRKNDIDVELMTAGEYKRTLTVLGENTEAGRRKFQEDLDETHGLFKGFVQQWRPQVDIERVGTGEHWYGQRAVELNLVDALRTSDDYLRARARDAELYALHWRNRRSIGQRLGLAFEGAADRLLLRWWQRSLHEPRF